MSETDTAQIYRLYCQYTQHLNQAVQFEGIRLSDVKTVSHYEFTATWISLPESRREFWRRRFEVGYEEVARIECRELVAAFESRNSTHAIVAPVRAA
jgi:hypothetical protein